MRLEVVVARIMGSKESFSSGTGGAVVGEVRWRGEGACTSVGRKGKLDMITPYSLVVADLLVLASGVCVEVIIFGHLSVNKLGK